MRNLPVWVLPAAAVVLGGILYVTGVLPERTAGPALAFALVILPAPYAGFRLAEVVTDAKIRYAFIGIGLLAAAFGAVSIYSALYPGDARYFGQLNEQQKLVPIGSVAAGAYMLSVEGQLPEREGEVNIEYKLRLGTGGDSAPIQGELWRRFDQVRVGKRGTAMQEHHRTYGKHTVFLKEGQGELELVSLSPPLAGGLSFKLFKILLPMSAFIIASAVLFAAGALLEGRFGNDRLRGLLATSLAFTAWVGYMYPDQMSEDALVKPAIGVGVTSIFFAILAGGAVAAILRKMLRAPATPSK